MNKYLIYILIFMALATTIPISCSKIFSGPSIEAEWVYSKVNYICQNGEFSHKFIYPDDSLGVRSATIIHSGTRESDNIFHLILNGDLTSVQRFTDLKETSGVNYSTVSDNSTVIRYFGNPEDESAELVFSRWDESGNPQHGYYFSFQFPFARRDGVLCDTVIVNFSKRID